MTAAPPYVGLAPFGIDDADRFFGRDAERTRIIANLQASRFTLLYARSGVGKSSLLRAGVVARLAGSRLEPVIFSSWSGDPNAELPKLLGGEALEPALEARARDGTLLVILDQFEEFFEYHHHTPEGRRFADDLARCVERRDLRAHFLVSIREDAYSRLGDEFKGRLPNVYSNYLHLDDLDERGARAAIEQPLALVDAAIEPALVDQVLRDVNRDGNGHYEAAHLQYVLRRLWDEEAARSASTLRLQTLQALGGSQAIFERHFDEAVAGLGQAEQDALAKAFRFLVTAGGTKRAESAADLAELTDVPLPTMERGLEHLRAARVLTPVAADGQTRYELAHDLLAAPALEWRRERERAAELRGLRRVVAGLAVVAAALAGLIVWALLERSTAGRQADRASAQALVAESAGQLSVDPERSLALARRAWTTSASPAAEDALRSALSASLVRDRLDIGTTWQGAISANGAVVAAEGPGGVQAWRDLKTRTAQLPGADAALSADGAVLAARGPKAVEIEANGKRREVPGADAPPAVSPDGRYVATWDGHRARVLDSGDGRVLAQQRIGPDAPVLGFAPDDRLLAYECNHGALVVWNWRGGAARVLHGKVADVNALPRGGDSPCGLAVSADSARVVLADPGGRVDLWDLRHGRPLARGVFRGLAVTDLAWNPRGDRFAVAAGKAATIFNRNGHRVSATPTQVDFVSSVAFNRDDLLVTSSRDGVARVWDVPTGGLLAELRGHKDEVADAAFAGRDVVTLSLDGTARRWQVEQGEVLRGSDWLLSAAFSPDGRRIAAAAADGTAWIRPLAGGAPTTVSSPYYPLTTADSVAFDRAGTRVAVAGGYRGEQGEVLVADAATGEIRQTILTPGSDVLTAAFSPDGRSLLTAAVGAPVAVWRLSDFAAVPQEQPPAVNLGVPGRTVLHAEFSPDGRSVLTAASDGIARVFDLRTRRVTRQLRGRGLLNGATYSRDGRRILTYGSDFTGRIWEARTGRRLAVLRGHSSWISGGAFSRDGRFVVTGSADQTTRVWDALTGRLVSTQRMHASAVNSVAYSRDDRTILSAGDDDAARIYPCATCAPVRDLVALARSRIVSG